MVVVRHRDTHNGSFCPS